MKRTFLAIVLSALGLGWIGPAAADGHHGHVGVGLMINPFWGPWYYPPAYYYPPYAPIVVEQPAPPIYIEQPVPAETSQPQAGYWHFCESAKGYYPYVRECPEGWLKVSPRPANTR